MRTFDYQRHYGALLTPDIVAMLAKIHEYKGEQTLFIEAKKDTLTQLVEVAKIQSTEASNKIEGIYTSDERLSKILKDKTMPATRSEKEIAGYRDVLALIHESHDYIPPKPSLILQMHRNLYKYSGSSVGGAYKIADNVISETDAQGNKTVRFRPVAAWETPTAMEQLCGAYERAVSGGELDPLLVIPMFILDFLCIHPFSDGNGRMSRLLTLLLLYRAGYIVGKYISIEKLIEQTKETYYEALMDSDHDWHEEQNNYAPFVRYLLGVVLAAYRDFSSRVQLLSVSGLSKPERVAAVIRDTIGKITRAQIMEQCPDVSQVTVERTLKELVSSGRVIKLSGGRYTAYIWNREME